MLAQYGDWFMDNKMQWLGFIALIVAFYFLFLHER